jgi:hypothetical protein
MKSCLLLIKKKLKILNIPFVSIDGSQATRARQVALNKFNDPDSGTNVLIISKAGTEGVSTRRTRHIVICEAAFNMALTEQAIARAVRFKSHYELPEKDRNVTVHRLILCADKDDVKVVENMPTTKQDDKFLINNLNDVTRHKLRTSLLKRAAKLYTGDAKIANLLDRYRTAETIEQRTAHKKKRTMFRKKAPFALDSILFEKRLLEGNTGHIFKDKDKIRLSQDTLFSKNLELYLNVYEEFKTENRQTTLNRSASADIALELISIKKQHTIDQFIGLMFKNNLVSTIEEYKSESTDKLAKSLLSGKPMKIILEEQRAINQSNLNNFLKVSDRIEKFLAESADFENVLIQHKVSEAKKRLTGAAGLQEYHTPFNIALKLISYSSKIRDNEPNLRILEPTAGYGSIVKAIVQTIRTDDYSIEMVEFNPNSRLVLEAYVDTLKNHLKLETTVDFLKYQSNEAYDLIAMNPPFHLRKQDTKLTKDMWDSDFVIKALPMLKDDGELIAITSPMLINHSRGKLKIGPFDIDDRKFDMTEIAKIENEKWKGEKGGQLRLSYNIYRIVRTNKQNIKTVKKRRENEGY